MVKSSYYLLMKLSVSVQVKEVLQPFNFYFIFSPRGGFPYPSLYFFKANLKAKQRVPPLLAPSRQAGKDDSAAHVS